MSNIDVPARNPFLDNDPDEVSNIVAASKVPRKTNPIPIQGINNGLSMIREENKDMNEDSDDDYMRSDSTPTIKIQSVESIQSLIGEDSK